MPSFAITDVAGQPVDLTMALRGLAEAFGRRFPEHNEPPHRLGRLCEEVGELAEEILRVAADGGQRARVRGNLVKELRDVLRAAFALAGHYHRDVRFRMPGNSERQPLVLLARLTAATGDCARWVHHHAGMGVKVEKHGAFRPERLGAAAQLVIDLVAEVTAYFALHEDLRVSVEETYRRYQRGGYLLPESPR
ncbi:hypothetical protein GCM10012275_29040 [Longimycelium tulufanense]|uniref:Uncharacterized protein n=1 Tax=Longimycelium tulufanense TaxID=907463 RepID=A0A8J3CG75_9PSEU|nr:MazG nucleotide pyrophosphohydrolase domain-containing protein [Longimycelium tulufanense]GGM56120.1 hypothetical protein GCM10012275_29040 [Longimycelium tulufanense]